MNSILGTMTFGPQVNLQHAIEMVDMYHSKGFCTLDTAFVYNNGQTEEMIGKILPKFENKQLNIASKVNPRITGKLDCDSVIAQCNKSLSRMNLDKLDMLYFHMPDKNTPIHSALEGYAKLYDQGKVKSLGLSNFPAWMVADIHHLCTKLSVPVPSIYQGLYNGISRNVEAELFDCLRALNMSFYAFNPLAGGLLSGKQLDYGAQPKSGRFQRLESYRKRYWKKDFFNAIQILVSKAKKHEILLAEAAYRWLIHHSLLNKEHGDSIIIGASNLNQLKSNLKFLNADPLPEELVDAFQLAWQITKNDSPGYFYFFHG